LEVLFSLALQRLREFPAQELANTLWAFAALLCSFKPDVLADIAEALRPRLKLPLAFRPAELSSTLWACAVLEVGDWPLQADFASVARQVLLLPASSGGTSSGAQGLSNTVWALATMRWQDTPMLASITCHTQPLLPVFSPQAIANTTWAFAKLEFKDLPLLEEISQRLRGEVALAQFRAQELASTAWSLVSLLCRDEPLLEFLGQEAAGRSLDVASRSMLLEALASAGRLRACEELMDCEPCELSLGLLPGAGAVLTLLETK